MDDRTELTEGQWWPIEPLLPPERDRPGAARPEQPGDDNAILWVHRIRLPWRDLPRGFGHEVSVIVLANRATVGQRRANREPPTLGGWNALFTFSGLDFLNPGVHLMLRANCTATWPGWPTAPRLKDLREA